ncbi:DNA-binding domain, methylated-DNA-[protein]-cysteine S-methyltransferase family protein [Prevotella sp. BV3P1]|nr:DNA-binding domain, methylated-DNA-[protein]-cysteine S-methyltransferase family protein [Prevotella sp. BV3P1]
MNTKLIPKQNERERWLQHALAHKHLTRSSAIDIIFFVIFVQQPSIFGMEQYIDTYASPLGIITMGSDGKQLTGLWFEGQKHFGDTLCDQPSHHALPIFDETRTWLDVYFQGKRPTFTPPMLLNDTPFRRTVWQLLLTIPYGETTTYKDIAMQWARQHGVKSMSSQAVGGAVGRNPISIIIPCHRVIGTNGSLTGYAGGLDRKRWLLKLEQANIDRFLQAQ